MRARVNAKNSCPVSLASAGATMKNALGGSR